MKIKIIISVILSFLILASCDSSLRKEKRVLVYIKNGEGFIHENIPASVDMILKMGKENGFMVDVSNDPSVFVKENLDKYSALIFSNTNNNIFDNNEQKLAFVRYIQAGGSFVGIHSACGSERQWPWFWKMLGGKFLRHPPMQKYTISVIDKNHRSTKFLGDTWEWEDEPYFLNNLNPDIHVVLAVDLSTVNDTKREEYPGVTFGDLFPAAWYHEFDGGRLFYSALGHEPEHYSDPKFIKHILGGIIWAIGENKKPDYSKAYATSVDN
ncbi:ThuA domain-containing protein [Bacteroidota bacterium]